MDLSAEDGFIFLAITISCSPVVVNDETSAPIEKWGGIFLIDAIFLGSALRPLVRRIIRCFLNGSLESIFKAADARQKRARKRSLYISIIN